MGGPEAAVARRKTVTPRLALRRGLTLVELLVVIAIIGLLVGLLMPAVQSARESSRRMSCAGNLKQMGIAVQQHIDAQGHLPTGGWGEGWKGLPDRGYGIQQPGGWIYNLLPYMDAAVIRDRAGDAVRDSAALAFFNCGSRRSGAIKSFAKSDYGANTCRTFDARHTDPNLPWDQTHFAVWPAPNCGSYGNPNVGDSPNCGPPVPNPPADSYVVERAGLVSRHTWMVGTVFRLSTVRPAGILDGLSHTYFAAEKSIAADEYLTGNDGGDRMDMYRGGFNLVLWNQPDRDPKSTWVQASRFGSAHPDVFNAVLCDGSVKAIPYSISLTLHQRLCNRKDGQVLDLQGL